ncbi:MAG: prephenate dehydratase [Bacteroidetes bacterium]|nr:MAG: prephenate dehydratase [Bacteroidota bacterium]TAG92068.1 MAG: prephenate dehydratase [Bacteroidota bacterium]
MNLNELRLKIDKLDDEILSFLNQRMKIVKTIGDLKKQNNAIIYRPEREKEILDRLVSLNQTQEGLLNPSSIDAIFMEIFAASRNLELPERVAYLGPEGSFTHQAAESRFGYLSDYIPLKNIRAVFESVVTERTRFGVVPIENNQEGFVDETIDFLNEFELNIVAEIVMPIHHTFASRCEKLSDIRCIYSKEIAFKQCRNFLANYFKDSHTEFIPVESTSKAAKMVMEEENTAAICSGVAAKLFRVPILFENIEDSPNNQTRFYVLAKQFQNQISGNDKTTLIVKLPNKAGTLANFLQDFNTFSINMNKIESRPNKDGNNFQSWFYIEIDGHQNEEKLQKIITSHQQSLRVVGSYVKLC